MTDLRAQLADALGEGYRIERELGGGGMSRVFLVLERALDRRVVVKVLAPALAYGVSVDRFRREIMVAARLQHPHLVPLLSAGEANGLPYFTMPYIEGESLRERLTRGGELPVVDVVRLLRDVGSALAYAHGKGVVHRDIKPENVLLSDQHAVVTDLGIAKALSAATESGTGALTTDGLALGTPAYMAPEQAAADPAVDHRVDIYALGLLAYELLTGRGPFAGRVPLGQIAAHLTEVPEPVTSRRPAVPPALAALVMRCLEKRPADRPQRVEEILAALDQIHVSSGTAATATRPSVAVLPMVNTSGDPENEHFGDGLTDELIGAFSRLPGITVTGRTSSFSLKGKGLSVRAITDLLKVDTVLEGTVRRAGDRLRVTVQLVNADGTVRWSDRYDRRLEDVFAVQEEIAQAVVTALEVELGSKRGPLVEPPTTDLTAYDLYLKGRFVRRRMGPGDMPRAIEYLEQAVARDPTFARAFAWLSDAHYLTVVLAGESPATGFARSRAYADRALALDPSLAEAHWAVGQLKAAPDYDLHAAERELSRAVALDPGFEEGRHLRAITLLHQGRHAEAIAELDATLACDPLLAAAMGTYARVYLSLRKPDQAILYAREALALEPGFSLARAELGLAYLEKAMPAEAVTELEAAARGGGPIERAYLAYGYALAGRRAEAAAIAAELGRSPSPPAFQIARVHVGLGETEAAFAWLERDERAPWMVTLKVDRTFDPLRSDPRYTRLVERIGL